MEQGNNHFAVRYLELSLNIPSLLDMYCKEFGQQAEVNFVEDIRKGGARQKSTLWSKQIFVSLHTSV